MRIEKIINATPHQINVLTDVNVNQNVQTKQYTANPELIELLAVFPPSGILPRVAMSNQLITEMKGIPIEAVVYGDIENLPPQEEGVYYIVSGLVAAAGVHINRYDLLAPCKLVRDESNSSTVLGCLSLQLQQ